MRIACFCIPIVQKTYCAHVLAVNCLVKQPANLCTTCNCTENVLCACASSKFLVKQLAIPVRYGTCSLHWVRRRRRVKRLAMSVCMYVYVQKTRLFTALLLEDCHEIALNSLVVEYLFFERRLQSRDSLLSHAMDMYLY